MSSSIPSSSSSTHVATPLGRPAGVVVDHATPPLCWGAVFAGAVVALSAHLLIMLFGVGLGLQVIDPVSDAEPIEGFSIGVGIAWTVGALLSLWLGGWVAGRLTPEPSRGLGGLHGGLVWSLATVLAAFMLASGSGMLVGGVAKVTGKGLAMVGEAGGAVAGGAGDFVSQLADDNADLLGSFARELAPSEGEGNGEAASTGDAVRSQREVSWALVRFFSQEEEGRTAEARQALEKTIADNSDLTEVEARERVQSWISSYDDAMENLSMMAERAEQEAREAAEAAADTITQVSVWTVIAFIVGAVAAICGGVRGARSRREHDAVTGMTV